MGMDLTGGLLVSFLMSELQPVLARHPRYRTNDGETYQVFSNLIMFRDVSVTIGNLRGESTRLSPDYFVGTSLGRAVVAQIEGHAGSFIEWIQEIDPTLQTPAPGMYLLAVAGVDEATRQVRFVQEFSRSAYGAIENADGSTIVVRPEIPLNLVQATDPTVQFERAGTRMWLTRFTPTLDLMTAGFQKNFYLKCASIISPATMP